eukprot:1518225-Rhodomonas_salina.3
MAMRLDSASYDPTDLHPLPEQRLELTATSKFAQGTYADPVTVSNSLEGNGTDLTLAAATSDHHWQARARRRLHSESG